MEGYERHFKGKRITVMGLGVLGRGVGDAEFLAQCGAEVLVTDKKRGDQLAASIERLKKYSNVSFKLGGHHPEDFTHCDMVLKAAGVRFDSPEIAAARAAGIEIAMSTALFAKYAADADATIVGVTGTRGKSTITHMIYHALRENGHRAHLGGNVRGISTLAMLPEIEAGDIAVLELDSWQLQGFGELRFSPHVAVFSNLMPDHQNYYKSMNEYYADKANIFRFQKTGDTLVMGAGIRERFPSPLPPVDPIIPLSLAPDWTLKIPGEHNRSNAALAAAALLSLGLNSIQIRSGLESFEGVEGRLQLLFEKNGTKIYNDNNATTPEATVAALRALSGESDTGITLIAGGSEKGLSLDELISEIQKTVDKVIVLVHPEYKGSERFMQALDTAAISYERAESLEGALSEARASEGTILFSPAFASFGMFTNEYERNDTFVQLVRDRA